MSKKPGSAERRVPTPSRHTPRADTPTGPLPPVFSPEECKPYPARTETPAEQRAARVQTPGASHRRGVGRPAHVEAQCSHPTATATASSSAAPRQVGFPNIQAAVSACGNTCGDVSDAELSRLEELSAREDVCAAASTLAASASPSQDWVCAAWERCRLGSSAAIPEMLQHVARADLLSGDVLDVAARAVRGVVSAYLCIECEGYAALKEGRERTCMQQFKSLFHHCRTPSTDWIGCELPSDAVTAYDGCNHICVLHKGSMFKLPVLDERGNPLSAACLRQALVEIDEMACEAAEAHHKNGGGAALSALTALPRPQRAHARRLLAGSKMLVKLNGDPGWELAVAESKQCLDGGIWRTMSSGGQTEELASPRPPKKTGTRVLRTVSVEAVTAGGAADSAGVRPGMQVQSVNGMPTCGIGHVEAALADGKDGEFVMVGFSDPRNAAAVKCAETAVFVLSIETGSGAADDSRAEAGMCSSADGRVCSGSGASRWFTHGLHLVVTAGYGWGEVHKRVHRTKRGDFGVHLDGECNTIKQVDEDSSAWSCGIRPGMKLASVNGTAVENTSAFEACVKAGAETADLNVAPELGVFVVAEGTCVDSVPVQWLAMHVHQVSVAESQAEKAESDQTTVKPVAMPGVLSPELAELADGARVPEYGSVQLHCHADSEEFECAGARALRRFDLDPESLVQVVGALAHFRLTGSVGNGQHMQLLNKFRGGRQLGRVSAASYHVLRFVKACSGKDPSRIHPQDDLSALLRQACRQQEELIVACEQGNDCLTTLCALPAAGHTALSEDPAFQRIVQAPAYTATRVCSRHLVGAASGVGVSSVSGIPESAAGSKLHFTYCVDDADSLRFSFVWATDEYRRYPGHFRDAMVECLALLRRQQAAAARRVRGPCCGAVHRTR